MPIQPLKVTLPLRILAMISSPTDCLQLDVEREWKLLCEALADLERDGKVILERLENAALQTLDRRLLRNEYHVLHFVGHGAFDRRIDAGVLILEDTDRRHRWMTGADLGIHLGDQPTLRLAVLNACEGARGSREDPFAGVAQSLVQQGLPAVIAMQFEITDQAAIAFSGGFYAALANGYPVDAALAQARKAIHAAGQGLEWGTPVLYLRARDGVVFEPWEEQLANEPQNALESRPVSKTDRNAPLTDKDCRHEAFAAARTSVRVFISYSHDGKEHCDRVLALAQHLRRHGIEADLDQFHQFEPSEWPKWYEERLRPENSDFVLCICTLEYCNLVEGSVGADVGRGVFWDGTVIYNYLYKRIPRKPYCVPVLLANEDEKHVPKLLTQRGLLP